MAHLFQCSIYTHKGINIKEIDYLLTKETLGDTPETQYIPNRSIERVSFLEERYGYYKLFPEEISLIKQHPNIKIVEALPGFSSFTSSSLIPLVTNRPNQNVTNTLHRQPPWTSNPYEIDQELWPDLINQGLYLHSTISPQPYWDYIETSSFLRAQSSSLQESDKYLKNIKNAYSGKGVDLVVYDTMVPWHYEFIKPDHVGGFSNNPFNIEETRVIPRLWAASSSLSGSITDPINHYTTESIKANDHGTSVASVTAGNNLGWAPECDIYNMYLDPSANPFQGTDRLYPDIGYQYLDSHALIKHFHISKSIDPSTGYKKPTVIVCSTSPRAKYTAEGFIEDGKPNINIFTHIDYVNVTGSSIGYIPSIRFDLYSIVSESSNPQGNVNGLIHNDIQVNKKRILLDTPTGDSYYITFSGSGYVVGTLGDDNVGRTEIKIDISNVTGSHVLPLNGFKDLTSTNELVLGASFGGELDFALGKTIDICSVLENKIYSFMFSGSSGFTTGSSNAYATHTASLQTAYDNITLEVIPTQSFFPQGSQVSNLNPYNVSRDDLFASPTTIESYTVDIGSELSSGSICEIFKNFINNGDYPFTATYNSNNSSSLLIKGNKNISLSNIPTRTSTTSLTFNKFPIISEKTGSNLIEGLYDVITSSFSSNINGLGIHNQTANLTRGGASLRSSRTRGILSFEATQYTGTATTIDIGGVSPGLGYLKLSSSFTTFNDFSFYKDVNISSPSPKTEYGANPKQSPLEDRQHHVWSATYEEQANELADLGIIFVIAAGNESHILCGSASEDDPYIRDYYHPMADNYYTWDINVNELNYIAGDKRYLNRQGFPGGNSSVIVGAVGWAVNSSRPGGDGSDNLSPYLSRSVSESYQIEPYTNTGPRIDVMAHTGDVIVAGGSNIISSSHYGSRPIVNLNPESNPAFYPTGLRTYSGTSFAGPQVAGMAVLYKQIYPNKGVNEFKDFLLKYSYPFPYVTDHTITSSMLSVDNYNYPAPPGSASLSGYIDDLNNQVYRPMFRSPGQDAIRVPYWPYSTKGGNISFSST
jgi:hypothetical protein